MNNKTNLIAIAIEKLIQQGGGGGGGSQGLYFG